MNWSMELFKAYELTLSANTVNEGLRKLNELTERYPKSVAPYRSLAEALLKDGQAEQAELIILTGLSNVRVKSPLLSLLGNIYLLEKKDLLGAIEWYTKSIAGSDNESSAGWFPYLYLSGIYRFYGFSTIARTLLGEARRIHRYGVELDEVFWQSLRGMSDRYPRDLMRNILQAVWDKVLKQFW
jgi:hypothetical protein